MCPPRAHRARASRQNVAARRHSAARRGGRGRGGAAAAVAGRRARAAVTAARRQRPVAAARGRRRGQRGQRAARAARGRRRASRGAAARRAAAVGADCAGGRGRAGWRRGRAGRGGGAAPAVAGGRVTRAARPLYRHEAGHGAAGRSPNCGHERCMQLCLRPYSLLAAYTCATPSTRTGATPRFPRCERRFPIAIRPQGLAFRRDGGSPVVAPAQ